ncbi:hypothetical protein DB30_04834 [Enhygromyxa salina]|uniref:Uncharacterized protein n=1 Tax=Enhygromyxa salina TaxID=215803 RepID=A0A0C2D8D9_9BACT|nr:hypothetical protein DB30_04834 [Enhygromyxa salina]
MFADARWTGRGPQAVLAAKARCLLGEPALAKLRPALISIGWAPRLSRSERG